MSNAATTKEIKARMDRRFAVLCDAIGVEPIDSSLGIRSSASFATAAEAETLKAALVGSKAPMVSVHHWSAAACPEFGADEWQVSWGDVS